MNYGEISAIIFSPPFEGGVAGTTYYQIIARINSRPGWLIGL